MIAIEEGLVGWGVVACSAKWTVDGFHSLAVSLDGLRYSSADAYWKASLDYFEAAAEESCRSAPDSYWHFASGIAAAVDTGYVLEHSPAPSFASLEDSAPGH